MTIGSSTGLAEYLGLPVQSQLVETNKDGRVVALLSPSARGAVIAVGTKDSQQLAVVARPLKSKAFSVVGMLSHTGTQDWKRWRPEIAVRWEF